jgi:A/G-specific adenine glycosylase
MLQQTTVAAGIPYFERWMARFPTVEALAGASEAEVLAQWQGLGYYSRARNLHRAAQMVVDSGWPRSAAEWRTLPGIGAYTSAAIASITLGEPIAAIDGNVERVFARITATGAVGSALTRQAREWGQSVLEVESPGEWNQAVMELGATVCSFRSPRCGECPVSSHCRSFGEGRVAEFPTPKPKKHWIELVHRVVVPIWGDEIGLVQAAKGEWWAGMWHPPRAEETSLVGERVGGFRHVVTRHKITVEVFAAEVKERLPGLNWVHRADLDEIALTSPGKRAIGMVLGRTQSNLELE